ncbi:hypothetical protein NQ317_016541 [Molorchus minor]|uniref:Alpha-2-macroglobulin receptor-associated protein domain-containing protein n=1 Tax=Molorchus minor TaxID=1323400 RepID=A0ABQ9J8E4_9CUCU|nr:hypothetical protein NQ317_016541 [Molorchus minor]
MYNLKIILGVIVLNSFVLLIQCHNKYSKDANEQKQKNENPDFRPVSLKHLDRPFRMAKLNFLWSKAVMRLTEPKLKSIFGELKLHDKEEITWKHLRAKAKTRTV